MIYRKKVLLMKEEGKDQQKQRGIAWFNPPSVPFTPLYLLLNQRGQENFHFYFWILKDLAWMQAIGGWYYCGYICGAFACAWSFLLCVKALFITKNYYEAYLSIGQALWLIANYVWMSGDLYDSNYSDDDGKLLYKERTIIAGNILLTAFLYLLIFFLFLKPLNIIPKPSVESKKIYDTPGLLPKRMQRFFSNWRDYENIHILLWCGKDLSWNYEIPETYWIFSTLTILVSIDFSVTSLFHSELLVDHAHFLATFFWVLGNIVWASGEFYSSEFDYPWPLFPHGSTEAFITARWWSSWILCIALVPIVILYFIWLKSCNCNCEMYKEEHAIINDENTVTVLDGVELNYMVRDLATITKDNVAQ